MAEYNLKLTGWKAVIGIGVLVLIIVFRIVSLSDKRADEKLMNEIKLLLKTERLPSDVAKMKEVYETGDMEELSGLAESIVATQIDIKSVKASFPLFNFSNKRKEVVVKVAYIIRDGDRLKESKERYDLFTYYPLGKNWWHKYKTSAVRYYLNFL
ncbi:MAG: hypothetical protein SWO11_09475 [Thermodesulfobacteriota bacterium]|nr:hypothetical protein [Thermodesulfobacteriota bacterium]